MYIFGKYDTENKMSVHLRAADRCTPTNQYMVNIDI